MSLKKYALLYHIILALPMPTDGVITSPENEVILALVLLNLEVVHFTVMAVWSPYQAAPVHATIQHTLPVMLHSRSTYSASMM
jgi:hypothetical protein